MKFVIISILACIAQPCLSQDSMRLHKNQMYVSVDAPNCICRKQLRFVMDYIEANNPAYQKLKENKKGHSAYLKSKAVYSEKSNFIKDTSQCLQVLKAYISLLEDHHTNVYLLRKNVTSKNNSPSEDSKRPYAFKAMSDSLNYLRISSFSGALQKELNFFYDSISIALMSKPYLVLDLRDNGGGNDACFYELMKFIYTKPMDVDDCDVWVSEENLKLYAKRYPDNKKLLERMKAAKLNSFIPISKNQVWKMDKVTHYPCRIFILQNKGMASTAEDLVLYAKQSKKVTTIGTNTGGYTGFGNIMSIRTPDDLFQLQTSTTRYKKGSKYEFKGIAPDIFLQDFSNWEETVASLIKKGKHNNDN